MVSMVVSLFLLFAAALSNQTQEENRSRRFGPDACGPVDPNYIRLANETGGQPMFLQPTEIAKSGHFMRESSGQNHVTLLWASARLAGATREFTVPVDSTLERLTFALSHDTRGIRMSVIRPSGSEVDPGDAGLEDTILSCSHTLTVKSPETGVWKVRVSGKGTFWLQAMGRSEIFFVSASFVAEGGRPGHEGLFRIPGQPLAGKLATLQVNFSGELQSAALKLVSQDGNLLKPLKIAQQVSSDNTSREYLSEFELPDTPFRVAVAGTDAKGEVFERYYSSLFHAESVEVKHAGSESDQVVPGSTTNLMFTIRNVGASATFHIVAADGYGFVSRVAPREISLASGAGATVTVEITIPEGTQEGRGFDVSVVASSTMPRATSNGAVVHLSVSKGRQ